MIGVPPNWNVLTFLLLLLLFFLTVFPLCWNILPPPSLVLQFAHFSGIPTLTFFSLGSRSSPGHHYTLDHSTITFPGLSRPTRSDPTKGVGHALFNISVLMGLSAVIQSTFTE